MASAIGYVAAVQGCGLTAARCLVVQMPLYAAACGASVLACIALVPRWGMTGAAMAATVSAGFNLLGRSLICAQVLRSGSARSG